MNQHGQIEATPITDDAVYNREMAKSLIDKIYFLDKVSANLFIDYGCADGVMLAFIERVFPGVRLIGYDIDEKMLETARSRNPNSSIIFTSDWNVVKDEVAKEKLLGNKSCLVLSSVLHEIHSYLTDGEQNKVHQEIWGQAGIVFDFIAFRDMMVAKTASRPTDPIQVTRIRQCFDQKRLAEWEANWGSIEENWSFVHLMLTYRYETNWARELKENYLPVSYEDFLASIPPHYMPIYKDHFTLPFLRRCVQDSFKIALNERTHLKLVLEHQP